MGRFDPFATPSVNGRFLRTAAIDHRRANRTENRPPEFALVGRDSQHFVATWLNRASGAAFDRALSISLRSEAIRDRHSRDAAALRTPATPSWLWGRLHRGRDGPQRPPLSLQHVAPTASHTSPWQLSQNLEKSVLFGQHANQALRTGCRSESRSGRKSSAPAARSPYCGAGLPGAGAPGGGAAIS